MVVGISRVRLLFTTSSYNRWELWGWDRWEQGCRQDGLHNVDCKELWPKRCRAQGPNLGRSRGRRGCA